MICHEPFCKDHSEIHRVVYMRSVSKKCGFNCRSGKLDIQGGCQQETDSLDYCPQCGIKSCYDCCDRCLRCGATCATHVWKTMNIISDLMAATIDLYQCHTSSLGRVEQLEPQGVRLGGANFSVAETSSNKYMQGRVMR